MKKHLLFTAVLLAGCEVTSTASLDPALCLDSDPPMVVSNSPFHEGVGQFSMTGEVQTAEMEAPFSGETVDAVYLVLSDDGSEAFDYFYAMAGKLAIDNIAREQLYLKLGVLEEGELKSSAHLGDAAEAEILSAVNSGEEITLNMLMGSSLGKGAAAESVNPCLIE